MKKLLAISLLSFSSLGQTWSVDTPSSEVKSRLVQSYSFLKGSQSPSASKSLYNRYHIDTRSGKAVADFIGRSIVLFQHKNDKPKICQIHDSKCNQTDATFSEYTRLPILGYRAWDMSFDLSKAHKKKRELGVYTSSDEILKITGPGSLYVPIESKDSLSSYDWLSETIGYFGISISSNYTRSGKFNLKKCRTIKETYFCEKDPGYFSDMANFTNVMIGYCRDCSELDKFYLSYLRSKYMMRIQNKEIINKGYDFIKRNKKDLDLLGADYETEERIYRQSLLM